MTIFWLQHQIGITVFLAIILLLTLSNLRTLKRLGSYPEPARFPFFSVLIPARNEESNIGNCVRSLLTQNYPDFEILVLDDNSSDGTWRILSELTSGNKRLRIFQGKPLPSGWLGKHWACHQLAELANGEMLLFTDADTRHHPNSLRDGVSAMIALDADLITAFPREEVVTWSERLMVPLFPWFIICFLPLSIAYKLRMPCMSAGIGQFMLFRRRAYEQIGGYEAIKQEVVDDVSLARRIKASGLRWRMLNGINRIQCRMYNNFHEVFMGFTKNLFAGFGYKISSFIMVWCWLGIVFLEPLVIMIMKASGVDLSNLSVSLAVTASVISLLIWGASHWCFGFPLYLTFFYPVSVILALAIAVNSMVFTLTGKASWKGRSFIKRKVSWW